MVAERREVRIRIVAVVSDVDECIFVVVDREKVIVSLEICDGLDTGEERNVMWDLTERERMRWIEMERENHRPRNGTLTYSCSTVRLSTVHEA